MKDNFDSIISRTTLFWLLITNVTILLPLYANATIWSIGICAICFVWRIGIYYGKVSAPPKYLVSGLAIGAAVTLALVASEIGALNALVNLLLLGYALKYIEMRAVRDVKVVVLVGYFLIAFALLEQQSMMFTAQMLLISVINACVLISVYQDHSSRKTNAIFGLKIMLQSLPLAILLFVVFPRLGPLWLAPNLKVAKTGLSNELSFGDISQLTRSDELAFRVGFEPESSQQQLPNDALYWRTLVLEDYDGQTWRQNPQILNQQRRAFSQKPQRELPNDVTDKLTYTIISEPSHKKWLYALDQAFSQEPHIVELADLRLYSARPIDQRLSYRVDSYPNSILNPQITPYTKRVDLALPANSNPQSMRFGKQLQQQYPSATVRAQAIMDYFSQQAFYYTLTPPTLGKEQIDEFLFDHRAGFCAHYASAFVFLARASGIPARMVTGYQGGEYNQKAGYYSVYQYMAHAWAEIWVEGVGWQRYDPTAMIAPERILDGFDATFDSQSSYLQDSPFSSLHMKQYPWLNDIRQTLASADFYWSVWVLGFDEQRKQQVLSKLLGQLDTQKLALFMLISLLLIGLMIAYYAGLFHASAQKDVLIKRYQRLCQRFAKAGVVRTQSQTVSQYNQQVSAAFAARKPKVAARFNQLSEIYNQLKYQPLSAQQRKRLLKRYRYLYLQLRLSSL
ncbi:DUF3488 and DUF4129 domain-containing transglutaminase family protein [Shewanella intestini]|uniref:DUF3488 domain-containing protein n=1 Tax=Shewanella intestini TaxID=2017544 RepID=A0ABS5I5D9_9GAMM|nr:MULTISPECIES: DUF3488 and transglutaminase-like domain-containing protein [Shewanella]MBR9729234.1 DUF3488 domain-containing protein [Shewanella intestini]MRG35379.1 DUF3488 domain-containing protein [Shewanella sp. XMDDZSB0408]